MTKFLNSCEAKHKKSLAHHFTSSSCSTDINALHDAYGAYVQFIALSTRFVINPSMLTFRARAFVPNVLLKMLSLFFFIFSRIFLSSEGDPKERERRNVEEEKVHHHKYIVRRRASSRTHVTKNRTIDGLEERANARCGRLRVEGARLLFACCCFSCVFARGLASGGELCLCAVEFEAEK